jgi:hypothetical protein
MMSSSRSVFARLSAWPRQIFDSRRVIPSGVEVSRLSR